MTTICALGDLLLDVVVTGSGPLRRAADTWSSVRVGAGGQAANVAAWAASLGARARLVTKRAADPAGALVADELGRLGVEVLGPVAAPGRGHTGVVVSLSGFDGERSMLTDRGPCPELAAAELDPSWFGGCDWLHIPLYSLVDAPIRRAALRARQCCPKASLDLSSVTVIEALGPEEVQRLVAQVAPAVLFANEAEASLVPLSGVPTMVTKLGDRGALVNGRRFPAREVEVVDSTGAGDAFAAGFLLGGPGLGLRASAVAVGRAGAMPARPTRPPGPAAPVYAGQPEAVAAQ
ncbi:MAG: carbohydrate kinase family protein [Acidimicrobiales bacterium]